MTVQNGAQQVSWRDYEGIDGFGSSTQEDLNNLNKALVAGQDINPPGSVVAGDGFALRVESLERTLRNTTYKMEHIKFWKSIDKISAYNTVEEYNQIQSYGDNTDGGFIAEGELPLEDDSKYERKFAIVKFMGTVRRLTHVASVIKPAHGNLIAQETVNGTMHLLKMLERALYYGDSDLSSLQFDGFEKLITDNSPAANIIDLRGLPLSEDILTDACLTIQDNPNYGTPTHLHLNLKTKADLVKTFFPKERYDLFQKTTSGNIGLDIKGFDSPAGSVAFEPNVFINDGGAPTAAIGDAAKRPATPTISTAATSPVDATASFTADDAGDYFYKIQAVNRYGRSAAIDAVAGPTAVTVAAGDKVTFGVSPGSGPDVEWYEIFRTIKDGASTATRLILRVANAGGTGEQVINDLNARLPFTTSAFLFQQNIENMAFKQLAPMVKIPLATIDSSIRWMQLIYGTPVLYTPGKNVLIKNVGRSANYVGQP